MHRLLRGVRTRLGSYAAIGFHSRQRKRSFNGADKVDQTASNQPEDLGSSPLHPCTFRPSEDRDLAAAAAEASFGRAAESFSERGGSWGGRRPASSSLLRLHDHMQACPPRAKLEASPHLHYPHLRLDDGMIHHVPLPSASLHSV